MTKTTATVAPATKPQPAVPSPAAAPSNPQVGGRFERLPDGSLRPLDEPGNLKPTH